MKVILTGATGYVGEGVLLAMLDDDRVEKVLSVGRRSCGVTHPKLEELLVPDLMDLSAGDRRLEGYDVVFFIAGITSVGTPKDVYKVISRDIPVHFAEIMPDKAGMSFIYLSGMGTSDKGRQYWQKVKSGTERAVSAMGFRYAYGWRPCFMSPYPGQKSKQVKMQKVAKFFFPLFRLFGMACTMPEMVDAMIEACTVGFPRLAVEARDIITLAKRK